MVPRRGPNLGSLVFDYFVFLNQRFRPLGLFAPDKSLTNGQNLELSTINIQVTSSR